MSNENNQPKRIVGLKAIAEYLRTSPRNIYRWEKELGFPLHRVGGTKGRSVFVVVEEVEEWLKKIDLSSPKKTPPPTVFSLARRRSVTALVLLFFLVAIYFIIQFFSHLNLNSHFQNPVTYEILGQMVAIKNSQGETLWSFPAYNTIIDERAWAQNPKVSLADIDQDNYNEIIAAPYHPERNQFILTLFDHDGRVIWSKEIRTKVSFQGLSFIKDFVPVRILFSSQPDGSWVIVTAWCHQVRFVSIIMTISLEGKIINEFINPGHLSRLLVVDFDNDREKDIVFSGTHNLLSGDGVIGILPLTGYSGITPPNRIEPEYEERSSFLKRYIADNTQVGQMKSCLRFHKPPYFQDLHETYAFANIKDFADQRLSVYFYPWRQLPSEIRLGFLIIFDQGLNILDAIPDSILIQQYNSLANTQPSLPTLDEIQEAITKNIFRWEKNQWVPVAKTNSRSAR